MAPRVNLVIILKKLCTIPEERTTFLFSCCGEKNIRDGNRFVMALTGGKDKKTHAQGKQNIPKPKPVPISVEETTEQKEETERYQHVQQTTKHQLMSRFGCQHLSTQTAMKQCILFYDISV